MGHCLIVKGHRTHRFNQFTFMGMVGGLWERNWYFSCWLVNIEKFQASGLRRAFHFSCWYCLSLDKPKMIASPKTEIEDWHMEEDVRADSVFSISVFVLAIIFGLFKLRQYQHEKWKALLSPEAWNIAWFNNCHFNFGKWPCNFQRSVEVTNFENKLSN